MSRLTSLPLQSWSLLTGQRIKADRQATASTLSWSKHTHTTLYTLNRVRVLVICSLKTRCKLSDKAYFINLSHKRWLGSRIVVVLLLFVCWQLLLHTSQRSTNLLRIVKSRLRFNKPCQTRGSSCCSVPLPLLPLLHLLLLLRLLASRRRRSWRRFGHLLIWL